jgi:hypothetical protein
MDSALGRALVQIFLGVMLGSLAFVPVPWTAWWTTGPARS